MSISWCSKYRPEQISEVVLSVDNSLIIHENLQKTIPDHLLFYGMPGTGKTSTAITFIKQHPFFSGSSMILNGSDEKTIDIIHNRIAPFAMSSSKTLFQSKQQTNTQKKGNLRFIFIDEIDYMNIESQRALKTVMDYAPPTTRFCFAGNYLNRIIPNLVQKCRLLIFNHLPPDIIIQSMRSICLKENLTITDNTFIILQKLFGSDMRRMINYLEQHCKNRELIIPLKIMTPEQWEQTQEEWKQTTDKISFVLQNAEEHNIGYLEWITEFIYHNRFQKKNSDPFSHPSHHILKIKNLLHQSEKYPAPIFIQQMYQTLFPTS